MVRNDVGGNATAVVTRNNNSVNLQNFWPAGRSVPFPHDAMTSLVSGRSALEKRAFLMSVIEGEGEACDPNNGACATAQIADNSRTTSGGTNPGYYKHLVALVQPAVGAGLITTFTATGAGCSPLSEAELAVANGGAVCIRSADYPVIKTWPVASCRRVPGYGTLSGYACGQPDQPSGTSPPPPPPAVSLTLSAGSIAIGGSSTLTWDGSPSTRCTAGGAWSGTVAIVGSISVSPPAVGSYTYTLTCDAGSASATLTVIDPSTAAITGFGSTPDPIPPGGPGWLWWTTTGLDANSCKVRTGGKVLASNLPTSSTAWPIPRAWLKGGTRFTLVCSSGGTKVSKALTVSVR
jgi:hypothetical protein